MLSDGTGNHLNPYLNNVREDDSIILAQGHGTGSLNPGLPPRLQNKHRPYYNYAVQKQPFAGQPTGLN